MNAEQIVTLLSGVRSCGQDKWMARCPAHEDRSPSLTIRETWDRVLVHCWAGCKAADVCATIGITLADLFLDSQGRVDPTVLQKRATLDGFEHWRQSELQRIAEELRGRDICKGAITRRVQAGRCSDDEEAVWVTLAHLFDGYSELEQSFDVLRTGTAREALEIYRA